MSDPIPVRISQLPATFSLNESDDLPIVQSGVTRRVSLTNLPNVSGPENGDSYYLLRNNVIQRIASINLPVVKFLGEIFSLPGNVRAPSVDFPAMCLTNFENSISVAITNWPLLTPWLRSQTLIYREGLSGQTQTFSGVVAGSILTLDDNVQNNNLLIALSRDQIAFGTYTDWRTVDFDDITYNISNINTVSREITLAGSPSAGAKNVVFYPYRISGSSTTARLHRYRSRRLVGTGTNDTITPLQNRGDFQVGTGATVFSATAATHLYQFGQQYVP